MNGVVWVDSVDSVGEACLREGFELGFGGCWLAGLLG